MDPRFPATPRNTLRRLPQRGTHEKSEIFSLLDEGFLCHVAFQAQDFPVVIPTLYARSGESVYLHGSAASRMIRDVSRGVPVSIAVTLVDGLVLARSAFHHSVNYRSVVIFGHAALVTDDAEKLLALRLFTDGIVRGRWDELRAPTPQELKATSVLRVPLEEASAKIRTGPPADDPEDITAPVWAGVVPLSTRIGTPIPDQHVTSELPAFDVSRVARGPERKPGM